MAATGGTDPGRTPGLYATLRSFWSVLVGTVHTRLDLVTLELEDEANRALRLLLVILGAFVCLATALFFAMFFLLALFWDTHYRLYVLGGIFGAYALGAIGLGIWARQLVFGRPRFLAQTLAELRKDVEHLQPVFKVEEPRS